MSSDVQGEFTDSRKSSSLYTKKETSEREALVLISPAFVETLRV